MENIYKFSVGVEEFEKIKEKTKVVHLYVADNKHKALAEGNEISFECEIDGKKQILDAVVESILFFPTIVEAVESIGREKCGFKNSQTFEKVSDIFLADEKSYEPIEKYGVGAIKFEIKEKK